MGVKMDGVEAYFPIPSCTGLWADGELLTQLHRHGISGRCISIVYEVAEPQVCSWPSVLTLALSGQHHLKLTLTSTIHEITLTLMISPPPSP